jgi:hypothetical protein
LNRVSRVVRLGVYVAATPEFMEHPKVAAAASELLRDVFGEEDDRNQKDNPCRGLK